MSEGLQILDELRRSCASVAGWAHHVRIDHEAIAGYGAALGPPLAAPGPELEPVGASREDHAAFWITLDAINFGSGWFPTLRKRPGHSGYFTIAAGVRERFQRIGPWRTGELAEITPEQIAAAVGQEPDHELMALFARSLNDLGRHLEHEHGGRFEALVDSAGASAPRLVQRLSECDCFSDTSTYRGLSIPFLKRAQITAADLHRAGVQRFSDLDRLTLFADNLVPHVLRLDGVLEFDPVLTQRIEREELIPHGAPEEIEIRACALHAVELLAGTRPDLTSAQIDEILWRRGGEPQYKARPRHRSRSTAY